MNEEWRPVVGSGGRYEVSNLGNVRSYARGYTPKLMALRAHPSGYPTVGLMVDGRHITAKVHQLVLAAFVGPRAPGHEVRHLDGVQTNNNLSNLAYGTHSENAQDSVVHGTNPQTRKTHCPAGHPYDETNTRIHKRSSCIERVCRACRAEWMRAYRAKRKAVSAA